MKSTCITAVSCLIFAANLTAQMRVHEINVGQGCATLVEFPCAAILIDTGGESNAFFNSTNALSAYLEDFFDSRPDLNHTFECVYLTHPHRDHTRGVPVILQAPYVIKNVVTDGLERGSGKSGQVKLHRLAQDSDSGTGPHIGFEAVTTDEIGNAGFTNTVIDPVHCTGTDPLIRVLWGTSITNPGWNDGDFKEDNNHSLVIKIEYGASSLLITGDLEEAAQASLIAKYGASSILDSDVYLVGHHGSRNGTTMALLDKVTPKMALIGVGDVSRKINWTAFAFGHPNKGVLDMLESSLTMTRPPITIQAGSGARTFSDYNVTKAIYATGWDDNILLEADKNGNWKEVDQASPFVPETLDAAPVVSHINLNTATKLELQTIPGIGATRSANIITYRRDHGKFRAWIDVDKVPGIGQATIELMKAWVEF